MDEAAFLTKLDTLLPDLSTQQRKAIIDAAAIAAYHAEVDFPVLPKAYSASADLR